MVLDSGVSAGADPTSARQEPALRVLHVIDTLDPGGAERVLVSSANALVAHGQAVVVCCTRRSGPLAADLADGVELAVLPRRRRWDPAALMGLARLIRVKQIQLVHSHLRHTMQLVALCKATGLIRVPHVFHDHYGEVQRDLAAPKTLRLATRLGVDAYIGVDEGLCRWATERLGVGAERVSLVPNRIDTGRFDGASRIDVRKEFDLGACDFVFAMVANLRSQKDHANLLHALARLPSDAKAAGVVVIGAIDADTGYYDSCRALADELGVASQVRFVGPRTDIASLVASCDGAVLSSVSESGPLAVLEYMAAGVPFVITDVGELTRQVAHVGAGFIVPPRDPEALALGMRRLMDATRDVRAEMGRRGREGARRFAPAEQVPDLIRLYEGLLA